MKTALYSITSSLHNELPLSASEESFIKSIEQCLGQPFEHHGADFSTYGEADRDIIYVRTGGTEGVFKSLGLDGDVTLLTSGRSNSLAASMEILAWLKSCGRQGRILHGSPDAIASGILGNEAGQAAPDRFFRPLSDIDFKGARAGIIGRPSDWLIASDVDPDKALERLGIRLVDIPISELIGKVCSRNVDLRSFAGSEAIYDALKEIISEYDLSALSIRCFDLLDSVHNTGCLALARLNAEGFPSSCEGDIPALISMMIAKARTGCCGFQCNLSRVEGDRLLFAHCTVPLDMAESYRYDTHFESGIGTAVKAEIKLGKVLIYKVSPSLDKEVAIPARIIANCSEANLCRTQVMVEAEGAAEYLLNAPLANHHIIVPCAEIQP